MKASVELGQEPSARLVVVRRTTWWKLKVRYLGQRSQMEPTNWSWQQAENCVLKGTWFISPLALKLQDLAAVRLRYDSA